MTSAGFMTWNTEWKAPKSVGWRWATEILLPRAEAAVLTELRLDALRTWGGHVAAGGVDWGYDNQHPERRKVALWSEQPWLDVDVVGSSDLPPGRYVSGTTELGRSQVRVVGVCMPWSGAHTRTGRRDRSPWEDHLTYLAGLPKVLSTEVERGRVCPDLS